VDVRFDGYAIPHVFARTDADAWRVVGYLQARDRLWQMELYRRAASGRLSELLGDATVVIDQRFLTLGLRDAAESEWERTPQNIKTAMESYAAGVNAAIGVPQAEQPLELQLLRVRPEPWTPIDSLAISKLFAWRLGENHRAELLRYSLTEEVGARAAELFPSVPAWAPVIVREPGGPATPRAAAFEYPRGLEWLDPGRRAMSNSWVVHGSRTATGRPILANDPHLQIELPAVWWEVHVVSDTLDVTGVTIPGIPFVIIGHNARLGWGLTNVGTDVQDFFVERLNEARTHYRVGEEWVPLKVTRHEIHVAGRSDSSIFEVRSTRHGPVQNAARWREQYPGDSANYARLDDTVLALKWDVLREGTSASAFDGLARATNWPEFLAAVRQFSAPAQNFVYADVDGNIGYAMSGLVPIRRESDGSMPVPGWPRDADWQGWIPPQQLPAMLNPPSGQIVTANNQIDVPFLVTRDWVAPFRAQRITELLGDRKGLDVAAMQQMQRDVTSRAADWILKDIELPPSATDLRNWDRRVDERPVVAVFEAFEEAMWRQTFGDEMDEPHYADFYRYAGNERFAGLHAIIGDPHSKWFDDAKTEAIESRADIVARAYEDAVSGLHARFGGTPARWDDAHAVKFSHPLGGGGWVLDWFFSRGPFPIAGDSMTVNKTTVDLRAPYATSEAASYRQILDVGDWDRSVAVTTTGQSGHPRSPHYFDQNALWRQGQYRAVPFSRDAVNAATVSRLELVP